jgi:hypothetical protein
MGGASPAGGAPFACQTPGMERPTKFEHSRWVGDKRSQVVYDVDNIDDPSIIDELMTAETFLSFGPDTLAEARNRGYKPYKGDGSGSGDAPTEG